MVYQISVEADTTSLEEPKALVRDEGEYCVIASNWAGEARTSCHVRVIAASPRQPAGTDADAGEFHEICPPGFTHIFHDLTADVGEPCTMRVTVDGNPLPKV